MGKKYVLYNAKAGNTSQNKDINIKKLQGYYPDEALECIYLSEDFDYSGFISSLEKDDQIIICGGDGTLNHFINSIDITALKNDLYLFGTGSGNDFLRDLGYKKGEAPVLITEYMKNLPLVYVNGKSYRFFNAIGFGLDGYCCERSDYLRSKGRKKVNYTVIALMGLFFRHKSSIAAITVDGKEHHFDNVWMAPTMFGTYFGGGALPAPAQRRDNENHHVSLAIIHGKSKLFFLGVFPTLFKGTHTKYPSIISIFEGHEVRVKFKEPCALQIDGETIPNVLEYYVDSRL